MGVGFSHGCWDLKPYSLFSRFRVALARTIGIHLRAMGGYEDDDFTWKALHWTQSEVPPQPDGIPWENCHPDPLHTLLLLPDTGGEIPWEKCLALAERIEELIPRLEAISENAGYGTWKDLAATFALGLRLAHAEKTNVEYG